MSTSRDVSSVVVADWLKSPDLFTKFPDSNCCSTSLWHHQFGLIPIGCSTLSLHSTLAYLMRCSEFFEISVFEMSQSILNISQLSVFWFTINSVELCRRPFLMKHINLVSICSVITEFSLLEHSPIFSFSDINKCKVFNLLFPISKLSLILTLKILYRIPSKFYSKYPIYVSLFS